MFSHNNWLIWYVMRLDSPNQALWVIFNVWNWYQSFIEGSNIRDVDSTEPWNTEKDHLPLGRSYLIVEAYDTACAS